jgi:hypothetical protein
MSTTSKFTKLAKLPDKTSVGVVRACARNLRPIAGWIETITCDNGKAFAKSPPAWVRSHISPSPITRGTWCADSAIFPKKHDQAIYKSVSEDNSLSICFP